MPIRVRGVPKRGSHVARAPFGAAATIARTAATWSAVGDRACFTVRLSTAGSAPGPDRSGSAMVAAAGMLGRIAADTASAAPAASR